MSAYLAEILAITFTGFAAVYPLLLWLTPRTLIDGGFYRFNQGMVSIVGTLGVVFFIFQMQAKHRGLLEQYG